MYTSSPSKATPRRPRSQPLPCQSMSTVFQSITCTTSRACRSIRQTPPWLSPFWLPRTTEVATRRFAFKRAARSVCAAPVSLEALAESQADALGPELGLHILETRIAELLGIPSLEGSHPIGTLGVEGIVQRQRDIELVWKRSANLELGKAPRFNAAPIGRYGATVGILVRRRRIVEALI